MNQRPFALAPADAPLMVTINCADVDWNCDPLGIEPVWVKPSIHTGLTMAGSGEVRLMVCAPAPLMKKRIALKSDELLALMIASRSEPAPESLVLVTRAGAYMRMMRTLSNSGACE